MNETLLIFERLKTIKKRGERAVFATVVRTLGSTYRKEGAKLLISEKGETFGSISAGCLETDVRAIVPEVIKTGIPKLLHYDNTAAEEIIWGLGLGCNGVVEVFVDLVDRIEEVEFRIQEEEPIALATVIKNVTSKNIQPGLKMFVERDGKTGGSLGDGELETRVTRDATDLLKRERSRTLRYELEPNQTVEVFIESILPPPPLVIFGAEPDAVPILNLAREIGFKIILVDHRPNFANSEKYPEVSETVVASTEEVTGKVPLNEKTFILIKTHNYLKDKEILRQALKSKAPYVGQLGPKARTDDLLKDLSDEGVEFSKKEIAKLYAPAGLDLGAESPEQIALSILAEMLAAKNGRQGGFLKTQIAAIHPRD